MDLRSLEENDPTFEEDLELSKEPVRRIAQWLNSKGYPVIVRPTFCRPSVAEMDEYSDDGDLEIIQRVEVKRRTIHFTNATDYPYSTIIVDVCHTFDKAHPKPYAYIILNNSMSHCAIIECRRTHLSWKRVKKHDRGKNRERWFYECPVGLARFEEVT